MGRGRSITVLSLSLSLYLHGIWTRRANAPSSTTPAISSSSIPLPFASFASFARLSSPAPKWVRPRRYSRQNTCPFVPPLCLLPLPFPSPHLGPLHPQDTPLLLGFVRSPAASATPSSTSIPSAPTSSPQPTSPAPKGRPVIAQSIALGTGRFFIKP